MVDRKKVRTGCLIGVLIFFVIAVVSLILFIVFFSKGIGSKKVEVDYDQSDLESVYEKLGHENDDDTPTINDFLEGNVLISSSSVSVDTVLSEEEVTALFDEFSDRNDYIRNIQVQFVDDDAFEMTFDVDVESIFELAAEEVPSLDKAAFMTEFIDSSNIYIKGDMTYDQKDLLELEYEQIMLGMVPVSDSVANESIDILENMINETIGNMAALNLETLEITEDGIEIVGEIPDEIGRIE